MNDRRSITFFGVLVVLLFATAVAVNGIWRALVETLVFTVAAAAIGVVLRAALRRLDRRT